MLRSSLKPIIAALLKISLHYIDLKEIANLFPKKYFFLYLDWIS